MYDFHASDIGTTLIPESKYYWQNHDKECCIVVPDTAMHQTDTPVEIHFVMKPGDGSIRCFGFEEPTTACVLGEQDTIHKSFVVDRLPDGRCIRPENPGRILNAIFDLIDNKSWSFPRAKAVEPYITAQQAELLETGFKTLVETKSRPGSIIATVTKAGAMLCERIGIKPDIILEVSHYDTETNTQIDDLITVRTDSQLDIQGRDVVVIDDLISSGRTARAVSDWLRGQGCKRVQVFALYCTVCSKEVGILRNVDVYAFFPLSNAYWTYGRGFDLTDDESRNTQDIYASTKHWDWENEDDVQYLIDYFLK